MRIIVPGWEDPQRSLEFGKLLNDLPYDAFYEFDFCDAAFATPGWLVSVGSALRRFREMRPNSKRQAINFKHLTYPAHVGFFKYFGVSFGLAPAEALGSSTYVPMTEVDVAFIKNEAANKSVNPGEIVEEEARRLAYLLSREDVGVIADTLTYSIREIVRNVVEHSGSISYTISAQYWPAQGAAELAVADSGCGILSSLKENPRLTIEDDNDAVKMALLPGISSKAWRKSRSDDVWGNSGYGLFMTQKLCSLGGQFTLLSGSSGIRTSEGFIQEISSKTHGTIVILRINTRAIDNLRGRLSEFREEGFKIAKRVGGTNKFGPSVASQFLKPTSDES